MTSAGRVLATLGTAAVAGLGYATLVERNAFTVRHESVAVLPAGYAPIRVLHLSDLHLAPWQQRKIEWIRGLAQWFPDVVIDTGDNYGHLDAFPALALALEPLLRLPGVYVDGNNDHVAPQPRNPLKYLTGPSEASRHAVAQIDTAQLHRLFDTAGWKSLNNTAAELDINGNRIRWFGTGDAHRGEDDPEAMRAAISQLPDETAFSIGVTHAPYQDTLNTLVDSGADIVFAGHTHGGQVQIPGYGALISNCDLPPKQAAGLSSWAHAGREVPLHVSNGLGTSIYAPIRFACRPSVTLLELTPRS